MRSIARCIIIAAAVTVTPACQGLGLLFPESDPQADQTAGSALRTDASSYLLEPDWVGLIPVWGALPGTNAAPAWASANVAGTYRMVLDEVVWNYTTQGQSFGQPVPLELRTSNEFTLRR
jgi:hypothetical protein